MDIQEVIDKIDKMNTPSFIFDINVLNDKIKLMRKHFHGKKICYAMKANPFLVPYIDKMVDRLEVCSPGEYEICVAHNISPDKIVVSGVNKTYESIKHICEYSKGQGVYTIESIKHYKIIEQVARENKYIMNVIIRLSSGNQFGVDKDALLSIAHMVTNSDCLRLKGIHYYSGTQKKIDKIEKELDIINDVLEQLKDKVDNIELEYGPGMQVEYFVSNNNIDDIQQMEQINELLNTKINTTNITLEFGRFIASTCGYYTTRVNDVKITDRTGYIIVDGGIHQLNYYGQIMGMKKPYISVIKGKGATNRCCNLNEEIQVNKWNICGSLCTSNDVIVRELELEKPCENDILVFHNTGAYSVTEGMALFLTRELPAIYIKDLNNNIECIRNVEQIYELMI